MRCTVRPWASMPPSATSSPGIFEISDSASAPNRDLVGRGAVGERVAAHRRTERRGFDGHLVDGFGAGREPQRIEPDGCRADPQVAAQRVVTERGDGEAVVPVRHAGERSASVDVRSGIEWRRRGVGAACAARPRRPRRPRASPGRRRGNAPLRTVPRRSRRRAEIAGAAVFFPGSSD